MSNTADLLRSKGIKATAQRVAIYQELSSNGHMSAEDVFSSLFNKMPMLSLATVYTTLRKFCQAGLASEMVVSNDRIYFDIKTDFHHHFVCEKCGEIYDVEIPFCSVLKSRDINGQQIRRFSGIFYGVCKRCSVNKEGDDVEREDGRGIE